MQAWHTEREAAEQRRCKGWMAPGEKLIYLLDLFLLGRKLTNSTMWNNKQGHMQQVKSALF